jgi:hypothetical protein
MLVSVITMVDSTLSDGVAATATGHRIADAMGNVAVTTASVVSAPQAQQQKNFFSIERLFHQ